MEQQNNTPQLKKEYQLFVDEYFKNGLNAVRAYKRVYINCSDESASANAFRVMAVDGVQNAIQKRYSELQQRNKISVDEIISDLKTIVEECKVDNDRKYILKALDQLSKLIGAYAPQKVEHINQQPLQINIIAPAIPAQKTITYEDATDVEPSPES